MTLPSTPPPPPSPPPSASAATPRSLATFSSLPTELISRIFSHIDSPLDLYHASLTSRASRLIAVDARIWERHYWTFWRAPAAREGNEGQDNGLPLQLRERREENGRLRGMRRWLEGVMKSPCYPPFLNVNVEPKETVLPDFHALFIKRIHADEALLRDLREHLELDCKILDNLLRIVERHGEGGREFLAAICADQKVSPKNAGQLISRSRAGPSAAEDTASAADVQHPWPRAVDIHTRAAAGHSQPHPSHCLSLHSTAAHLLSHLQRRDAILSLRKLRNPPPNSLDFKERVFACSEGVQQAMIDIALFRSGERSDMMEWLDLVALWVWADIKERARRSSPNAKTQRENDGNNPIDLQAPAGSTRLLVTQISRSLHRLGFCISPPPTDSEEEVEVNRNEFFLNVTLYCQPYHATSPRMYAALLCCVARRLGVAMTLLDARGQVLTVVVEEGEEPEGWADAEGEGGDGQTGRGSKKKWWDRFYYSPAGGGDECGKIIEAGEVVEHLARTDSEPSVGPGKPLDILAIMAEELKAGKRYGGSGLIWGTDEEHDVSPVLVELRDYLTGRAPSMMPPFPLLPATKPSSLTHLPSRTLGAARAQPPGLKELSTYTVHWALSFARPNRAPQGGAPGAADGWHRVHQEVYSGILDEWPRRLDLATLLEMHGGDAKQELEIIRGGRGQPGGGGGGDPLANPNQGNGIVASRIPGSVRQYVSLTLSNDATLNHDGVGGHGAGVEILDPDRSNMELLSHANPLNKRVQHGVGTLFKHKTRGWRGVVVGWDSVGSRERAKGYGLDVSTLPSPGLNQPFYHVYHEDGTRRYVAQCDVEVARIPLGSTQEEATEVLKGYTATALCGLWRVMRCFRGLVVNGGWEGRKEGEAEDGGGEGKEEEGEEGEEGGEGEGWRSWESPGAIRLLMTPWMRVAWPDG